MNDDLPVLTELEHRLIAACYGDGGRAGRRTRWLRWPLAAVGPLVTAVGIAIAVIVLSAAKPGAPNNQAQAALYRAANAAAAQSQPAFGPGEFWYMRVLEKLVAPRSPVPNYATTTESWVGYDGVNRVRSVQPARNVSGENSVTVDYPYYGAGQGFGLSEALFSDAQVAALPTALDQLRAAIKAGQRRLTRQEDALKVQIVRTPGTGTTATLKFHSYRSKLSAAQQRSLKLLQTIGPLLAGPVTPAVRASLYRLIATLPGLRYQGNVRDALGRFGTAVSLGRRNDRLTLVFDPATGDVLSESLDGLLTETLVAEGFASSITRLPPGLAPVRGTAPAILAATVSPHTGGPFTIFSVVQSIRNQPASQPGDSLLGPTARSCKAELFPGPSPKLRGGARTTGALGGRAFRYRFGPESIGRRVWCRGQYQLQVTGVNGREATAYFYVK